MISERDLEQANVANAQFRPAIRSVRYDADSDRVELETEWCTLKIARSRIEEFQGLSSGDLEGIYVSHYGVHIDSANIDINAAGLITQLARQLEKEVENSF